MNNLKIENHLLRSTDQLTDNLADDLLLNASRGQAAVVCRSPNKLMNDIKKELAKLDEYSDTLNLSASLPNDFLTANVTFATVDDFMLVPPICAVLYITCDVEKHKQYMITSWMPPHSLIITYI